MQTLILNDLTAGTTLTLSAQPKAQDAVASAASGSQTPADGYTSATCYISGVVNAQASATPLADASGWTAVFSNTSGWTKGRAKVTFIATAPAGGGPVVVAEGGFNILPSPTATGQDVRSFGEKLKEAIEAAMQGRATDGQLEFEYGNRRLKYLSIEELTKAHQYACQLVANETATARRKAGLYSPNTIYSRLV